MAAAVPCPGGQSTSREAMSPHFLSPSGYLFYLSLKHTSIPEQAAEETVLSQCCFLIAACCPAQGRAPAPRAEGLPGPTTPQRWSAPSTVLHACCRPRAVPALLAVCAGLVLGVCVPARGQSYFLPEAGFLRGLNLCRKICSEAGQPRSPLRPDPGPPAAQGATAP